MYLSCQGAVEIETPIDQQMDLISIEIEIFPAKIYFGLSASSGLNSNPPLPVALGLAEGGVSRSLCPLQKVAVEKGGDGRSVEHPSQAPAAAQASGAVQRRRTSRGKGQAGSFHSPGQTLLSPGNEDRDLLLFCRFHVPM